MATTTAARPGSTTNVLSAPKDSTLIQRGFVAKFPCCVVNLTWLKVYVFLATKGIMLLIILASWQLLVLDALIGMETLVSNAHKDVI